MKILIVRHADPDYSIDSLTETGWKEASLLAERIGKLTPRACFVSPLGRARDTASLSLEKLQMEAEVCEWLREFNPRILRPDVAPDGRKNAWDWLPQDWMAYPEFFTIDKWRENPIYEEGQVAKEYDYVVSNLDQLIERFGYKREGHYYRAIEPNHDTIILFCHFGVECVLLSHLLNLPLVSVFHAFCAAPSSVTTINTEERREGIASFRMAAFGDISHLYTKGQEPSFAARFCECYTDDARHD